MRWIAAGVLAMCLGGLGSALLYSSLADSHTVLKLNRTVYRGEIVGGADLGPVTLGSAVGVPSILAENANQVIGQTALVDLPAGSLVVPGSVGAAEVPMGTSRIGLRLAPGRIPNSPLPAGTSVLLVAIAKDSQSDPDGSSVAAEVATSPQQLADGAYVLDVAVPSSEAERVARLAAAELLVLVREREG